jgi:hypothetical protein
MSGIELALLETDVVGEAGTDLVQDARVERRVAGERVGACADVNVVAQHSRDERVVRVAVVRVGGSRISSSSRMWLRPCSSQYSANAARAAPAVRQSRARASGQRKAPGGGRAKA